MPRRSQTELAVLGALSVEPMTGYRLRAVITEALGHFWHESFGQIYPTLSALEAAHLVEREGTATSGAFRLTAAGDEHLRALLAEPFDPPPARDPLLLRLFFARHVAPELTRERLLHALGSARSRGEEFARIRAEVEAEGGADAVHRLITLSAGEHAARARASWAQEALELLDRVAVDPPPATGATPRGRAGRATGTGG